MELFYDDASACEGLPGAAEVELWAWSAAENSQRRCEELTIRVVSIEEGELLNQRYRGKQLPTNVLSFPFEDPPGVNSGILGDVVICAAVVKQEAIEQGKTLQAHFAHMVVHGVLHLCGFDHEEDSDARRMESLEKKTMGKLGFDDPYK